MYIGSVLGWLMPHKPSRATQTGNTVGRNFPGCEGNLVLLPWLLKHKGRSAK